MVTYQPNNVCLFRAGCLEYLKWILRGFGDRLWHRLYVDDNNSFVQIEKFLNSLHLRELQAVSKEQKLVLLSRLLHPHQYKSHLGIGVFDICMMIHFTLYCDWARKCIINVLCCFLLNFSVVFAPCNAYLHSAQALNLHPVTLTRPLSFYFT